MRTSIALELRMVMSGGGFTNPEHFSSEAPKSSRSSPTFTLTSLLYSVIVVGILLFSNINGACGHPLVAHDITESNNNLLHWWLHGEEAVGRQMDAPEGVEVGTEKIKGLDLATGGGDDDAVGDDDGLPELEQEVSRSNQRSGLILMGHPRRKKGLSYLSKFYSEALLHHNGGNVVGNSSSSKETQYFGERMGLGGGNLGGGGIVSSTSSGEHSKFPSNIRRKLSFYPPLTLMSPWRSILSGGSAGMSGGGRGSALRLRWGK